jgi:DNA helicase-2/ATP-dependent DNA helicase PcrA
MRDRVTKLLAGQRLQSAPLISTFHSLCVRVLRREIEKLEEGYTRSFTIYDQDDTTRVVKASIKDLGYDDQRLAPRATQSAISHAKNSGLDPELYAARVDHADEKRAAIARVFRLYEERLVSNNALDFDDLLIKTVRLLRKRQDVREHYNDRFRYILVDEYQDTNALQFALIHFLTERQQNVCVVGDETRASTAGAGPTSRTSSTSRQHYQGDAPIKLEQNYRSTQNILEPADVGHHAATPRAATRRSGRPARGSHIRYYQAFGRRGRGALRRRQDRRAPPAGARTCAPPSSTAPTPSRASSRRRCAAPACPTTSSAASPSTSAPRVRDVVCLPQAGPQPARLHRAAARHQHPDARARQADARRARRVARGIRRLALGGPSAYRRAGRGLQSARRLRAQAASRTSSNARLAARRSSRPPSRQGAPSSTPATPTRSDGEHRGGRGRCENLQELVNAAVDYDKEEGGGLRDFIDAAALTSDADQYSATRPSRS